MLTHDEMIEKMLSDPAVKAAYDDLEDEFALFDEVLKARKRTGLTQAEIAARMGTKAPAVARLESGGGSKRHSPSIATLRRYAEAVGCKLKIELVPIQHP
ncbi:MAG: helix-turn-helix domain-containing protein [Proteobacteria bacterium]|jgi:predicted transcriptional regulator|nr:helix-turn-helix domain-containing protein [Pseudomonadota bacterium]MBU4371973.1 helix-turn-helix domain-containing protein [Pseudomonadota bacterium]MBU4582200.1 helix-turn-helix domain-containing protein [Pseudomonadota bacterium]MCG2739545.1 helix-turn-helix domain-containing protein [Syntrophaceae bacterium]